MVINSTSVLNYGLGTVSDKIAVTGALTLNGTINVTAVAGFSLGTYDIITYTGALTNNTLNIGVMPSGYGAIVNDTGSIIQLVVTANLLTNKQAYGQNVGQEIGQN